MISFHSMCNNNNNELSKNFDESLHWGGGGKLMWHQPFRNNAVICSSRTAAVIDYFAAYSAALTRSTFQWAGQPPKIGVYPWGLQTPSNNGSLDPPESTNTNGILIGSAVFQQQQIDTQTDHATLYVALAW